ncbi:MAG: hypothetical protein QXE31_03635 [Candidatus Woesearchaeota archaeon]
MIKLKKTQITIFFIVGIIVLLFLILMLYKNTNLGFSKSNYFEFSYESNIKEMIKLCIADAAKTEIEKTGIDENNIELFKNQVKQKTKLCTEQLFSEVEKKNYQVQEGDLQINVQLNEETITLDVNYFVELKKENQKIEFREFIVNIDKTNFVRIPNGITDRDIVIKSIDGKVDLLFSKGTKILDKNGNPVDKISIKIHDTNFNGFENKVVHSNIVYEGLPDGVVFSKPVIFSYDVDETTLPLPINNYRIATWDSEKNLWRGLKTEYKNGRLIANIDGFSYKSPLTDCNTLKIIKSDLLFKPMYYFNELCESEGNCLCDNDKDNWAISYYLDNNKVYTTLLAKNEPKYFDKRNNVIYGYYENNDINKEFIKCDEMLKSIHDKCVENGRYYNPYYNFENRLCLDSNLIEDVSKNLAYDPETIKILSGEIDSIKMCSNKKYGEYCGSSNVCMPIREGFCECRYIENDNLEKNDGYCDSRCVGGKAEGEDYLLSIPYEPGNLCIAEEKTLLISVVSYCSSGDSCFVLPYTIKEGNINKKSLYKIEHNKIKIKGIYVPNTNLNHCAYGGVIVNFLGSTTLPSYFDKV